MVCHKTCRKEITVTCLKAVTTTLDDDEEIKEYDQKINQLAKRIESLQTESTIEARILDGILKMDAAKNKDKKKRNVNEPDISTQIEKSKKKIDLLNGEIAKCKQQIEALKEEQRMAQINNERINSVEELNIGNTQSKDNIRYIINVYYTPQNSNTTIKKGFNVKASTLFSDILKHAYKKLGISEDDFDNYALVCRPPNQGTANFKEMPNF
jgi:chromosome segregation ATPase